MGKMREKFGHPEVAAQRPSKDAGPGRRPSRLAPQGDGDGAALEYEIAREKAISLGRLGRRLEAALEALRAFDAAEAGARRSREREALLSEAGTLLWYFVVQREACGLRDSARLMQDYAVPKDVHTRMGFSRRTTEHGRQPKNR
jgi:Family of unknown function (DUF6665)